MLSQKGQRHGFGIYRFANNDWYEGEWRLDKKHGKGILYYSNGEMYKGCW